MSTDFQLNAARREVRGSGANKRLRRSGKVPGVLYGAGKGDVALTIDHDELRHSLDVEAFHSAIINVKVDGAAEQAILRAVQMHPFRPQILHVDFQRVSATQKLHIKVPVHFVGEDVAPGVKLAGGILSHLMNEVDISCLPKDLPEYLELDVSQLELNQSLHLSDIKVPEGVEITAMAHGGEDLAVASIAPARVAAEELEEAEAEEAEMEAEEAGAEGAAEGED